MALDKRPMPHLLRGKSMNLTNPSELKQVIESHGFSFSKGLGQNFLIDSKILEKIITGSKINGSMGVLEIGPGAGTLTRELAQAATKVVAVEIDNRLMPLLNTTLSDFNNVKIINDDILKVDLHQLFADEFESLDVCVVANLPYYITTPIIMKLLEENLPVKSITVMIQKEVADRMIAIPGGKDYGALTAAVQFYTTPSIICKAEPHCFLPQPKVESTVINLVVASEPTVKVNNKDLMFKIIKSAFGQRRKTLINALAHSPYLKVEKTTITKALESMELDINIRGERLSLADFAKLSDILEEDLRYDK